MHILSNYNSIKLRKPVDIILISFLSFLCSCYKETDFKNETYYFMRGVFINDTTPVIRLFKNSLNGEQKVSPAKYEVKIQSDKGETEMMQNEVFTKIKLRVGTKYTVKWKLKEENVWNSIDKYIPYPDTANIVPSKLITENDRLYFKNINIPVSDMFFWGEDQGGSQYNISDFQYTYGMYLWGGVSDFFLLFEPSYTNLQIYPTNVWNKLNRAYFFEPCLTPFNWFPSILSLKRMSLVQCSKRDIELFKQINQNNFLASEPLYSGEPIKWDYQENKHLGHIFSYYRYNNIKLIDLIPKKEEEEVTYTLLFDNKPVDTSKIEFSVSCLFEGSENFNFLQSSATKNQLFFKDYIASFYNYYFNKPCGYYNPEYDFKIRVTYSFKPLVKPIKVYTYVTERIKYSNKSLNIEVNVN